MWIFRRSSLELIALAALSLAVWHCGADGECLRYSDCADGLTCAAGHCVPPPADESDASAEPDAAVAVFEASTGMPGTDAAATADAGDGSSSVRSDAATGVDDASAD